MRFCGDHWAKLKAALHARGLEQFMAKSSAELGERMTTELEGGDPAKSFEPLMGAHNAILANALRVAGLDLMAPKEDGGEWCPICYLLTCKCGDPECPKRFEGWIEKAADDALAVAKSLGLVTVS